MRILVLGANGFLGQRLLKALFESGHSVIAGVGVLPSFRQDGVRYVEIDFAQFLSAENWIPELEDVDVVINTVGLLRESKHSTFDIVHEQAPAALFHACQEVGVKLVIHVSALGADKEAASSYHLSKRTADDMLRALDIPAFILQPSLIFGPEGASTQWFTMLSSLPLLILPQRGNQLVQPIHVDDVTSLVQALVPLKPAGVITLPVAGPEKITLQEYLASLRKQMGLGSQKVFGLNHALSHLLAKIGDRVERSFITSETLNMLERSNTADIKDLSFFLGKEPRGIKDFITPFEAHYLRNIALLAWLLPLMRLSIAVVWIVTGILSLGVFPVQDSYALLAELGLTGLPAAIALYGGAILDIGLGLATLLLRKRKVLWIMQIGVILGYTLLLSWYIPGFWLHPFGPLLKNIPMMVSIYFLLQMERPYGISPR